MKRHDFFQTPIWIDKLNIDNNKLINEMKIFQKNNIGKSVSNAGGYQGQNFFNQELNDNILRTIPKNSKELNISHIHFWININKKGDSNGRHAHGPYSPIFLCGVYYAKVPKNSGRFKFYDPRGSWMQSMSEYIYYDDGFIDYNITPQDGMIILFPSWLEHSVEENKSDDERITVAFNIMLDKKNDYGRQKWFMCSGNSVQGYFNP
jgi:uncharacterized protein (TIGR02466 family)